MILTFDNKFDQIDEADCMFILKSPRNFEWKLAHIYGMNKGKVCISCVLYTNGYVNVNE
jgi:hypothetical protein